MSTQGAGDWGQGTGKRRRSAVGGRLRPALFVVQCVLLIVLVSGCTATTATTTPPVTATPQTPYLWPYGIVLAEPQWLAERRNDPNIRIVDVSEQPQYALGHIPGAVHAYWQDLVERNAETYGKLAGMPERERVFGGLGITEATTVVVYDRADNRAAARFAWALWYAGHPNVRLLNGGLAAWAAAGQEIERTPRTAPRTTYRDLPDESVLVNRCDLAQQLNDPQTVVLDVRTDAEVTQTWGETMTVGSIPNARRLPWTSFIADPKTPAFRSPDDLRRMLANVGATLEKTILLYGTFSTDAALPFFALKALGYINVRLYDGGWAEWGASPTIARLMPPCD